LSALRPQAIAFLNKEVAGNLEASLPGETEFYFGEDGLVTLATREDVDLVLVAVVGIAGLLPTLEALKAGKTVALATKEALAAGGNLIREALKEALHREEGQVREAPRSEEQIVGGCLTSQRRTGRERPYAPKSLLRKAKGNASLPNPVSQPPA